MRIWKPVENPEVGMVVWTEFAPIFSDRNCMIACQILVIKDTDVEITPLASDHATFWVKMDDLKVQRQRAVIQQPVNQ